MPIRNYDDDPDLDWVSGMCIGILSLMVIAMACYVLRGCEQRKIEPRFEREAMVQKPKPYNPPERFELIPIQTADGIIFETWLE